jgi:hypothetical protein
MKTIAIDAVAPTFATVVTVSFAFAILIRCLVERPIVRMRNLLRGHRLYD